MASTSTPHILHIETSTTVCSVALSKGTEVLFEKASFEGPSHASLVGTYMEEALTILKEKKEIPDAVAVSGGPGSYTGLRIGVSAAKGVCFGYGIPLIHVPTLDILANTVIDQNKETEAFYCAMLDARRMEVYSAIYDANGKQVRNTMADIVTSETYSSFLEKGTVYFFGNGAAKCKEVIASPHAVFVEGIDPLAIRMIPLSNALFEAGKFVDVAYFEPFYLKEFQVTIAKNKVLG